LLNPLRTGLSRRAGELQKKRRVVVIGLRSASLHPARACCEGADSLHCALAQP
jgi:hypothetical protein